MSTFGKVNYLQFYINVHQWILMGFLAAVFIMLKDGRLALDKYLCMFHFQVSLSIYCQ